MTVSAIGAVSGIGVGKSVGVSQSRGQPPSNSVSEDERRRVSSSGTNLRLHKRRKQTIRYTKHAGGVRPA